MSPRWAGAGKWRRWVSRQEGTGTGRGQIRQDGRWARGQAGLMVQARAVEGGSQAQAKPSRRAPRVHVACLANGDRQTKVLN